MFKETLSKIFKVDGLIDNLTGYVESRVELVKVEVREELAKGLAQGAGYLFIAFIFALFLVFISIAAALLLGYWLGIVEGFSVVGALYLILAIILWFSRERLIRKLETRFAFMFRRKK